MKFIKNFETLRLSDISLVGGKNASLGQMIAELGRAKGILVPHGFAIVAQAYWYYLDYNNLLGRMKELMAQLTNIQDIVTLRSIGKQVRMLIEHGKMPDDLADEIAQAYKALSKHYECEAVDVAVRSSATAEDLPTASFAGQQETFLNIRGIEEVLVSCKRSMASLFTDRAIVYRVEHGFDHFKVALSVGIQKMVRSDLASAGVAFSLDTESGFKDVVVINSAYGLGETVVKGTVNPDEFIIYKPKLREGFTPIIKKYCGDKQVKCIVTESLKEPTKIVAVEKDKQRRFSLSDQDILELARAVLTIEDYYSEIKKHWLPMDVEWAKDGIDGKLYILQARPETVHALEKYDVITRYVLENHDAYKPIVTGLSIGQKIVSGKARIIKKVTEIDKIKDGDILVTEMTDPDWVPAMKRAAGIITDRGGRTCHAAIVSRELGITAIVGTDNASTILVDGQPITIDCSRGKIGFVYSGELPFKIVKIKLHEIPAVPVDVMINMADPDNAFSVSFLPTAGVGLARVEFIISNTIKVHPMALIHPDDVDVKLKEEIEEITCAYPTKKRFFIECLAQGVGMIAAAFYPRPVIVRFSDFKSNEYRNLIGGTYFEPIEENPMLGFRGAFRYYNKRYSEAFALECAALKYVREGMGLTNVKIMIPFVRTVDEGEHVLKEMAQHGLNRGDNGLEIIMMNEIPSNVLLIDEFSQFFNGFSIGSNDLTQLVLGVDRDSEVLAGEFDERDPAVIKMLEMAVRGAQRNKRSIGICGQAPSDYPEIAQLLINLGINSISLNIDSVLPFFARYSETK